MQNISDTLPAVNNTVITANQNNGTSLSPRCKTCGITGDNKVLVSHKYNCPQKEIPCNNCLKKFTIQQIPAHATVCEEVEVKYTFGKDKNLMIKKTVLSSIKLAEEVLNNNDYIHDDEKITIYKQAVISYNKLIDKFNSTSVQSSFMKHGIISYDEYKKIIDTNIQLEKNKLLNNNSEDEITKNYLQKKIKYKIDSLPEVDITVGELLHIKEAEKMIKNGNTPNEDELSFYQQAVTIYKELIVNLESGRHREKCEFDEWLSIRSTLDENPSLRENYHINKRLKIKIPEKPLITPDFQLRLVNDAGMPFHNISGNLFSFISADKTKNYTLTTFEPSYSCFPNNVEYNITVKINSTPNYHTAEDIGIYFLLTPYRNFSMARRDSKKTKYILAVSYIDKEDYKNFLFSISFTAMELFENLHCTDIQDQSTKFGYLTRSKKMKQLNRFFNDDGIGTEHINKHGCDSIFGIEFYKKDDEPYNLSNRQQRPDNCKPM
jgi:hypothetical protein